MACTLAICLQRLSSFSAALFAHTCCLRLMTLYNIYKPAVHLRLPRVTNQIQACFEFVQQLEVNTHQAVQVIHIDAAGKRVRCYCSHTCFVVQEFNTIWHSWLTLFSFMMTGFEFGIFYDCSNPEAATILMVLYMFVVAVIFLNLLIGIMADSWKTVSLSCAVSCTVIRSQPHFELGW